MCDSILLFFTITMAFAIGIDTIRKMRKGKMWSVEKTLMFSAFCASAVFLALHVFILTK